VDRLSTQGLCGGSHKTIKSVEFWHFSEIIILLMLIQFSGGVLQLKFVSGKQENGSKFSNSTLNRNGAELFGILHLGTILHLRKCTLHKSRDLPNSTQNFDLERSSSLESISIRVSIPPQHACLTEYFQRQLRKYAAVAKVRTHNPENQEHNHYLQNLVEVHITNFDICRPNNNRCINFFVTEMI
jgi:hypothetical protein